MYGVGSVCLCGVCDVCMVCGVCFCVMCVGCVCVGCVMCAWCVGFANVCVRVFLFRMCCWVVCIRAVSYVGDLVLRHSTFHSVYMWVWMYWGF